MKNLIILTFLSLAMNISCQSKNTQTKTGEQEVNKMKESSIENAGASKRPSGTIKFKVNNENIDLPKNQNQCMIVGMGNDYGQLTVSGGNTLTIIYVGNLKLGVIPVHRVAGMPDLGLQVIYKGEAYNTKDDDPIVEITKMTKDGNNYYIAGKFSGVLKTMDGKKSINVSDGIFESDYVN
jgi:hypothetical protein